MLKKVTFITLFLFTGLLYAANEPAEAAKDVPAAAPAPVVAPTPAPVPAAAPKAPKKVEDPNNPEYHYLYVPDEKDDGVPNYEDETMAGHRGNLVFSFMGEGVVYKGSNRGRPGFDAEVGWQIKMFKYLSLFPSINAGYRKGNVVGKNLAPVGAKAALRFRLLPWLFPYGEGGIECLKVTSAGWEPASKIFGGGILIRIGYVDRKAEYHLYKLVGITRTMLILGFDYLKTPHNSAEVPDAYLFKGGLSFEF